ncbi:MAG: alanine racemase [Devosiaceae bacterium]|nr:alanine racemase [Devosiaceae bacterium]
MNAHIGQFSGRLTIDLGAIARNWKGLDTISANSLTAAVVKANAYGCGMERVAATLSHAGAQFFFVATPDEGLTLRTQMPNAHIFILNGLFAGAGKLYAQHNLMPVINSLPMLDEWLAICLEAGEALPAGFQFDTGMNRLGFRLLDISIVQSRIKETGYLPQVIMSHLACADIPAHEKNNTQRALFQSVIAQFPQIPASLANSAAILGGRENHFQMVRPGISLYGGRAIQGRPNPMAGVVTLEMPLIQIREARTGESVGYGATQTLNRDSRLAIVGAGYSDGMLRSASSSNARSGGFVAIKGKLAPILGRVSMDTIIVDITELGPAIPDPGEMIEIIGPNISIDDLADASGTIGYEILTSLHGRFNRFYRDESGNLSEG